MHEGRRGDPTSRLLEITSHLALDGTIDAIAGLADDRVWIFHGAADPVVRKPVADALEAYYQALVDPAEYRARSNTRKAGHTFPTRSESAAACEATASPFIRQLWPRRGARPARNTCMAIFATEGRRRTPSSVEFDQRPLLRDLGAAMGCAERGWIFIPRPARPLALRTAGCTVDLSWLRAGQIVHRRPVRAGLGLPRVGRSERPGTCCSRRSSRSYQALNPKGCWDWWGYGGRHVRREGRAADDCRSPHGRRRAGRTGELIRPARGCAASVEHAQAADSLHALRRAAGSLS